MHLAQVVSFVSLCATRTWKNWKTPSTLNTVSYRVCRGGLRLQLGAAPREVHGVKLLSNRRRNFEPRLQALVTQSE